jgi:ABC-type phosphate transport system substrate-binding protein
MMRLLSLLGCVALLAATALATTYTTVRYHNTSSSNNNRLTLTAQGGSFTIPASATVKVYDAQGTEVNPQPSLIINPTQGQTGVTTCTIDVKDGTFPANGQVIVSRIDTTDTNPKPTGTFTLH